MADKPQDTTSKVVNSQEIWKYLSLFTIAVIALSLLVFVVFVVLFMPLKGARIDEIVAKLSELEGINKDMKTKVGTLEGAHIDEIVTKLSELEEINKELETKVGTLEEQLKDNALQKTCDATESTCRYHDDNLEILTSEVKKRIDSEIKSKLVELKKHMDVNDLGQIASKDIESFMKKLAEMESRFTTRLGDEIEQKLSELEQRLNGGKALENEKKHVFTSTDGEAGESTSYLKLFVRVLLWIVGFATFAFAVFVIGVVVASFIKEGLPKEIGEWLLVSGGLLCCITVVFTVVYLSDVYLKYGREELFVSLANLLFK